MGEDVTEHKTVTNCVQIWRNCFGRTGSKVI